MVYLCTIQVTSEDKLSNKAFIQSLEELNRVVIDNKSHHKIILRKDFIDTYFPYNQVGEYINNVTNINPNILFETEYYVLQSKIDNDILSLITDNLSKDDLMLIMQFKYHDFVEALLKLIKGYSETKNFELEGASIISSLRETIDSLNREVERLRDALDKESLNKADVQDKLSVLVKRINYTHNIGVSEDMLFISEHNNYDKVIYIKEFTRVQYVDTLVYSLQEILKLLYSMPTRLLVIESYYANGKIRQYPKLKPHYKLTERDVLSEDILMLGYQPNLFRDIMRNPSNISIIIILDRAGYTSPHLFGDNVEYIFTASDLDDVPEDVPKSRVISYSKDTLNIPYIKDFNELSISQRVQRYSSLPIIKQLINMIQ